MSNDDNNDLNVLIENLKDDDPEKRKEAADNLGETGNAVAVDPLINT